MKVLCRGIALIIAACLTFESGGISYAASQEVNRVSLIGKYDSADTCTVRSVDTQNKQIKFRNHATGKGYTLNYDNTSFIYDQYGRAISASLLAEGEVVDIRFLKSTRHLTYMQISDTAWTSSNVTSFNLIANEDGIVKVNGQSYKMDRSALIIDDGVLVSPESILQIDTITVKGIDKEIYSVVVNNGHGYVSLSSDTVDDTSLVGAWLELDNSVIKKVTPNMLLSVAEGEYKLHILGNGADYTEKIQVSSNHETVIDTSKIEVEKPKEGLVTFEVTPENAQVFVDGEEKLTGVPVSIVYGYHSLKVMADGYVTQTKYLKVGTPNSVISVDLEKDSSAEEDTTDTTTNAATVASTNKTKEKSSESSDSASKASTKKKTSDVSGNSSSSSAVDSNGYVTGYYVNILGPVGAAVYFNGNYVGIAPVKIKKKVGVHAITIDESGTVNSYTIEIDSEQTNVNLTFPTRKTSSDSSSSSSTSSTSSSAAPSSTSSSEDSSSSATSASSSDSSSSASSASTSSEDSSDSATSASSASDAATSASSASSEATTTSTEEITSNSGSETSENGNSSEKASQEDVSDAATTGACN